MASASSGASKVEGEYKNGACQCLRPWRDSQQAFAETLKLANKSPLHMV